MFYCLELQLLVLFGAKMAWDGCWRDQGVSPDKKSSFVHGVVYPDAHPQFEPLAGVFYQHILSTLVPQCEFGNSITNGGS